MSFSLDIKTEMFKIDIDEICCARAELAGIICFGTSIGPEGIKLRSEHSIVAERFYRLVKHIYNLSPGIALSDNGFFSVGITDDNALKILRDTRLASVPIRIDREIVRRDCCKMSFVRGAFFGGGSISNPQKGYHAEFNTNRYSLCGDFEEILHYFEIYPKRINRNGNNVFYLKESEQIEQLLGVLGAHSRMMDFMNVKIEKEIKNMENRRGNCEAANVDKICKTAVSQILAVKKIKDKTGLESLSIELMETAKTRVENPQASLSEMAKIMGVSKSCINHRMRKITEIAKEL